MWHRHKPADDIFWINGRKHYGQVCSCGATRYMTVAVHFPQATKRDIWTKWKLGTEWSKFKPL